LVIKTLDPDWDSLEMLDQDSVYLDPKLCQIGIILPNPCSDLDLEE
jgi:hypothetical protein